MAQNVESNVNINVTANAGQADAEFIQLNKMLGEIVTTAGELNKQDFVSKSQVDNLKALSDQFISLAETSKITDEQFDQLQASFEQVEQRAMSPVFSKLQAQFDVLDNQVAQFANNLQNLVPSSVFDENALSTLTKANKLYEETYNIITNAYEKGQISSGSYNNLMEKLAETGKNYNDVLKEQGVSYEKVTQYQKALTDISNGSILKSLMEQSTIGKMSADEAKRAADEEQRRQIALEQLNKEYNDIASKQQAEEERQRRINEFYEKRARDEEEFNKRREDALKRQAELQENLNKTYSELGGGGTKAPDGAFSDSIQKLADTANSDALKNGNANLLEFIQNSGISEKAISKIASELGISTKEFKALSEVLGTSAAELAVFAGAAAVVVAAIKILVDQAQDMKKTFDNVALSLGDFASDSFKWFVDSLQSVIDIAEQAIGTLEKLADAGIELERAFLTTSAYIGQEATDNVYNFIDSISSASNTMFASINDVVAAAGSMGLASDQLVEATENMTIMGRNLGVLIGDTKKAFQDLGQTISKGYVGRNSILYRIFTKQEIEQVRKLGSEVERYNFIMERSGRVQELYNEYIQTAAGKVSLLRMQWQELLTNIGTIALNLYAIIAPVLTQLLQIANQLLAVFIKVFNWEPKSVGINSVAADIGNSLDKITGSADKASKKLASFDDVIQISEDSKGGGVGDVGDLGALGDFSDLLGDVIDQSNDLEDIWAHFKELMESGDYFGAGKEFMNVIGGLLNSIDWEAIKKKLKSLAYDISQFINGIFDESNLDNWKAVGKTIGEAINSAFAFLKELLLDIDFKNVGKSLGAAWKEMWETIDAKEVADTLYIAIYDAFQLLAGWLEGGGLTTAAKKIAEIIKNFFGQFLKGDNLDIDLDNMVNVITGIIDDIINALYTIVEALTSDDVRKVVFTLIEKLVGAFKDNAADWGQKLGTIAKDILSFLEDAIETADNAGLDDAISTFLDSMDLGNILQRYITLKVRKWWMEFKYNALYNLKAVGGIIYESLQNTLGMLLALVFSWGVQLMSKWADIMYAIRMAVINAILFLEEKFKEALNFILTLFDTIVDAAIQFGVNILAAISEIGEGINRSFVFVVESIKAIFTELWNFIKGIFDGGNWLDLGKEAIEALWQGIKDIWNSTIGSWSFDIPGFEIAGKKWDGIHFDMPKLATGGIVTGPTTALIGEAGAEAVLPLKNNTQWMDILASKVANQITNGNGINGGTIRLELTDKPFYTRAEMYEFGALVAQSLNAYGINIAVV